MTDPAPTPEQRVAVSLNCHVDAVNVEMDRFNANPIPRLVLAERMETEIRVARALYDRINPDDLKTLQGRIAGLNAALLIIKTKSTPQ